MDVKRDHGLDILRSFAILMVLLLHARQAVHGLPEGLSYIFAYGWIGVDLFFVLSGFLIGQQALKVSGQAKSSQLHVFWAKRWFRTLPLYFTVLFAYMVLKPLFLGLPFQGEKWPFFIFAQNYFLLTDYIQSWSICIEEQFYILLPLMTFVFIPKLSQKPQLWLFFVFSNVAIRFFVFTEMESFLAPDFDYHLRFPIYTHFDGLSAGVFLAATKERWQTVSGLVKTVCVAVGLILLLIGAVYFGPQLNKSNAVFYFTLTSLCFSLMLIGFHKLRIDPKVHSFFYWVAMLSYGAYLWNNIFIRVIYKYIPAIHWLAGILLFLLVTHGVAFITYYLIEKPALSLRSKYLARLR